MAAATMMELSEGSGGSRRPVRQQGSRLRRRLAFDAMETAIGAEEEPSVDQELETLEKLSDQDAAMADKYGFDFKHGQPLDSEDAEFEWCQPLPEDDHIPAPYLKTYSDPAPDTAGPHRVPYAPRKARPVSIRRHAADDAGASPPSTSAGGGTLQSAAPAAPQPALPEPSRKRKQKDILEFFPKKLKRSPPAELRPARKGLRL